MTASMVQIVGSEKAMRELTKEWNAQPPKPRPIGHLGRQQAIEVFEDRLKRYQRTADHGRLPWITGEGHYSAKSVDELKPIRLAEMQVPDVHIGRVLLCRLLSNPIHLVGSEVLVEDLTGDCKTASFYNFSFYGSNGDVSWMKPGAIILVKEPWLFYDCDYETDRNTEGKSSRVVLRVDSPSDVIFVRDSDFDTLSRMDARSWYQEEKLSFEALKEMGNRAFAKDDFDGAVAFYDRAMSVADCGDKRNIIHLNLAAAKLSLAHYDEAYKHAEVAIDVNREKALYRMGRAAYGMRKWLIAVNHFETIAAEFSANEKVQTKLAISKARLAEATSGKYNLPALYAAISGGELPHLDVADFTGPVKVVDVPMKGRGLVATEDVKAGSLLMVSKAYAMSVTRDSHGLSVNFLYAGTGGKKFATGDGLLADAKCVVEVVQKLRKQPGTASELYALYDGDTAAKGQQGARLEEGIIDPGRIERICHYNSFAEDAGGVQSAGLWLLPSYLNHSCLGNSNRVFYGDVMFVYALWDVKAGEELTTAYFTAASKSLSERRLRLRKWDFQCNCRLCTLDKEDEDGEKKRDRLMSNFEQFKGLVLAGMLSPGIVLKQALSFVAEMRATYAGRVGLRNCLPSLLEMLAFAYNQNGQYDKQIETMRELLECVSESVLKFQYLPKYHRDLAKFLLEAKNDMRGARRVANEAFELTRVERGFDRKLFLKKHPEFSEFMH